MPLHGGKENIGSNIETEESHGKKHKQAVAIALDVARRSGAKIPGAKKSEAVMKAAAELVKGGYTPARALEKAMAEPVQKSEASAAPKAPAYEKKLHDGKPPKGFHQCKTGDPGCFHCNTCGQSPEDCSGHKTQKGEYAPDMMKRVSELTKAGYCPSMAVKKARDEHDVAADKMKKAGGMTGGGMGDAGPMPGSAAGPY